MTYIKKMLWKIAIMRVCMPGDPTKIAVEIIYPNLFHEKMA